MVIAETLTGKPARSEAMRATIHSLLRFGSRAADDHVFDIFGSANPWRGPALP